MFPNVFQQEIVNYLDICEDDNILKNLYFKKTNKKIWNKNSRTTVQWKKWKNILMKTWLVNDKIHREDGHAIEWTDGELHWFINNGRHREDGPAIIRADGTVCYYINDIILSKLNFDNYIKTKNKKYLIRAIVL